ncbi:hypothetical protein KAW65_06640 [candidate division WOR-3 bacterium]|nr:hypothetical protein [candidate division WOR-3 bacterium]
MKFLKQKRGGGLIFFMLFAVVIALVSILWKPWGRVIFYGLCGVMSLREAMVLWRRTKMIYMAIFMTIGSITSWVFFVLILVMPESYESWRQIWLPVAIVMLILLTIERKKNPDKMKKWNSVGMKASFFEFISFKYIADLED